MSLLEAVPGDSGVPVVNRMVPVVVGQPIGPTDVGSSARSGIEVVLNFRPVEERGVTPNQGDNPVKAEEVQPAVPCADSQEGHPEKGNLLCGLESGELNQRSDVSKPGIAENRFEEPEPDHIAIFIKEAVIPVVQMELFAICIEEPVMLGMLATVVIQGEAERIAAEEFTPLIEAAGLEQVEVAGFVRQRFSQPELYHSDQPDGKDVNNPAPDLLAGGDDA